MARKNSSFLHLSGVRWRGLTTQLFLLIVLPLVILLLGITFGSLYLHQKGMRTLVGERDERAARTSASAMGEQLNHRAAAVQSLALRASENASLEEVLNSSDFLFPDFDAGLAFFTPQGELLVAAGDHSLWNSGDDEFNRQLLDFLSQVDAQPKFSLTMRDPVNGENIILVAAADQEGERIAVGAFYPATLARKVLTGAFSPGDRALAFVVDSDYQVLYEIGNFVSQEDLHKHPGVEDGLRGESGTSYLQVDGSEHVVAFSPVPTANWALVIEEPWDAVASPLLNTTQLAPLILVPVVILALLALWFGTRKIVQPLQDLETRAADLAWGDFHAIEESVGGIDEIERLQRTLIHLAHKIQSAQQSLRGYIGAITAGQEDERRRLARELHDDTLQSLIALNQRVQLMSMNLSEGKTADQLVEIQGLIEHTIEDLRRFTRALRPLYLEDLGLVAALDMLAREVSQTSSVSVEFHRVGSEQRLEPEIELALYRMAQEGLNNIVNHAKAEHASIGIHFLDSGVVLTVSDDGIGFEVPESPAEFAPTGHFGLLGIHERAELIGARLEINSIPGQGTHLKVTLPLLP
jgi:two-component system sensor histidine kinase UhpB